MPPPDDFDNDTLPPLTCNGQLGTGRLPSDAWHHYYHYQSSAQYLWLAETLCALDMQKKALAAYDRAIFQDHFNEEALEGKKAIAWWQMREAKMPVYNKHPFFDLEFRSLIGELPGDATQPHDEGATALLAGDIAKALLHFQKAIAADPHHSNSYFGLGKCRFFERRFDEARADFEEAIRLSHQHHDMYHRLASGEHLARGREFLAGGELDLAIADFTKALDLHRKNKEALKARAEAYRMKGNVALAEADEKLL